MRNNPKKLLASLIGCLVRRQPAAARRQVQEPSTLGVAVSQGVAIGTVVGLALTLAKGMAVQLAGVAALSCGALGALIGLLIWCECDDLPDEPILLPPDRGDRSRSKR